MEINLEAAAQKELEKINNNIEKAERLVKEQKYKQAKKIVKDLVETIEMTDEIFMNDTERVYFFFRNPLEGMLTKFIFKPGKSIEIATFDFCKVYYLYGVILASEAKFDSALIQLKNAYRWNPVCAEVYLAEEEIFLATKKYDELFKRIKEGIAVAYTRKTLAAHYRYLGMYYMAMEDYETASAIFHLSISYNPDERKSASQIAHIEKLREKKATPPTVTELKMLMQMKDVPIGVNSDILQLCYQSGMEARDEKKYPVARFYLTTLYSLTEDPEIEKVINEIIAIEQSMNK